MDFSKLKNPLQAAAEWAERMAGAAAAPVGTPMPQKPEPPRRRAAAAREAAPEAPEAPASDAPAAPPENAAETPASHAAAPELFPREAHTAAPAARPRRRRGSFDELRYVLWSIAIVIGLLGTVIAFIAGALG